MSDYICQACGTEYDLPKKQTNEAVRKKHACTVCDAMTTFERVDYDLTEMTEEKRDFLRRVNPTIRVTRNTSTNKTMHIVDGDSTLCNVEADTREVEVSKYPQGYLDWCTFCLHAASGKQSPRDAPDVTKEACLKAIQDANRRIEKRITADRYREIGQSPSLYSIRKKWGSWSEAKENALS